MYYAFHGRIDELRIYNKALSAGEVGGDKEVPLSAQKKGPVAAFPLDEGTGTTAEDTIGGGHNGTLSGSGVFFTTSGRYGGALQFTGAPGCVTLENPEGLKFEEEFTLEAWVRPEGALTNLPIAWKEGEGSVAYDLGIGLQTPGRGEGQIGTGTSRFTAASPASMEQNVWQHLAATYDGSKLRLYLNGELVATRAVSATRSGAKGAMTIGCGGGNYFHGRIDELRIYNKALSAGEVGGDKEVPLSAQKKGPVAAFPLDEGTGTTAEDTIGGGHNGTLSGSGVFFTTSGRYGGALQFTGAPGCVTLENPEGLKFEEEFTLDAWVRPEGALTNLPILWRDGGGFPAYDLGIGLTTPGKGEGQLGATGGSRFSASSPASMQANVWQHLAATYDGSKLRLYLDGELVATRAVSGRVPGAEAGAVTIGCGGGWQFKGRIDEVRIYNRALGSEEIGTDRETPLAAPRRSPVVAYALDDAEGNSAYDITGGGHNGTLSGSGVSFTTSGRYGGALQFTGAPGCVTLENPEGLKFEEEFTLEAWVRPEGALTNLPIAWKEGEGSVAYDLGIGLTTPGKGEGQLGATGGSRFSASSPASMQANVWQHLAATYDGSKLRLYLDGELVATRAVSGRVPGAEAGAVTIGCGGGWQFKGRIDEVRIYNRALGSGEIGTDRGVALQTPSTGPIAAFPLDEGTGTTAEDTSGGGHNGTLSGSGVSFTTSGRYGGALQFTGTNGCLTVAEPGTVQLGEEYSLEAWVRPEATAHLPIVYRDGGGLAAYDLGIGLQTPGRGEGQIGTGTSRFTAASPASMEQNVWQHLAATYDGSKLRLYLNGELVATRAVSATTSGATEGTLTIGCGGGQFFKGRIDEVRLYDRALTPPEVSASLGPLAYARTMTAEGTNEAEALLVATINPEGEETKFSFEYGTTTAYGETAPAESDFSEEILDGDEPQEVEEAVANLQPATTYHFRVRATNERGTIFGRDQTLTTASEPAQPRTVTSAPSVSRQLLGLTWAGDESRTRNDETATLVQDSRASMFRVQLRGDCAANQELVGNEAAKGIRILPYFAEIGTQRTIPSEQSRRKGFIENLAKLVSCFKPGGSYWQSGYKQEHPGKSSMPIEWWEIWNEENFGPNGDESEKPDAPLYAELLIECSDVIHASGGKVLFGGLLSVAPKKGKFSHKTPGTFLKNVKKFLDAKGKAGAFDGIALHPYAFDGYVPKKAKKATEKDPRPTDGADVNYVVGRVEAHIRSLKAEMRALFISGKPIWITEIGWPVGQKDENGKPIAEEDGFHLLVNEEIQAELIKKSLEMMSGHPLIGSKKGEFGIEKVFVYALEDLTNHGTPMSWEHHCGLRETIYAPEHGRPRKAWTAFKALTE